MFGLLFGGKDKSHYSATGRRASWTDKCVHYNISTVLYACRLPKVPCFRKDCPEFPRNFRPLRKRAKSGRLEKQLATGRLGHLRTTLGRASRFESLAADDYDRGKIRTALRIQGANALSRDVRICLGFSGLGFAVKLTYPNGVAYSSPGSRREPRTLGRHRRWNQTLKGFHKMAARTRFPC